MKNGGLSINAELMYNWYCTRTRKRKRESSSSYTCLRCGEVFSNREYRHRMLQHVEEIPQGDPERALAGDDPELQQEFRVNHAHIYRGHSLESIPVIYNFPT